MNTSRTVGILQNHLFIGGRNIYSEKINYIESLENYSDVLTLCLWSLYQYLHVTLSGENAIVNGLYWHPF